MHKKLYYTASMVVLIATSVILFGCGTQSSTGGGVPAPQPITQPSTSSTGPSSGSPSSTPTAKQGKVANSGTGNGNLNSSSGSGSHLTGSKQGTSSGTTRVGNSQGGASGSSAPTSTAISGFVLTTVSVARDGTSSSFVPLSSAVTSIWIPSGWTMQAVTSTPNGTVISMHDPSDSSQLLREVVQTSKRDLQGFYDNMNTVQPNAAQWIVQGQSLQFTQDNPSFLYRDRGIVANNSTGGSIRVDLYVPNSDASAADKILYSFLGASSTTQ